jgi:hypothetical protein
MERGLSEGFENVKVKTSDCTDYDLSILEQGVPCICRCIVHSVGRNTIPTRGGIHRSPNLFCKQEDVHSREELYYHGTRRIGNGLCTIEVHTLFIGVLV